MPCYSCQKNDEIIEKLDQHDSDWLSQSEVQSICPSCAENMVSLGITRIKKQFLIDKFSGENKMILFELTFTGAKNSIMNIGHISLNSYEPQYFEEHELPISLYKLKKLADLNIAKVERETKPSLIESKMAGAALAGKVGVMWVGASPKRVNDYGTFVKNVPNYDLDEETTKKVLKLSGFKKV